MDLSDALNSESIAGVLNDPNLIRELSPHLPNTGGNESTEQQLRSTITSPQFQQVWFFAEAEKFLLKCISREIFIFIGCKYVQRGITVWSFRASRSAVSSWGKCC